MFNRKYKEEIKRLKGEIYKVVEENHKLSQMLEEIEDSDNTFIRTIMRLLDNTPTVDELNDVIKYINTRIELCKKSRRRKESEMYQLYKDTFLLLIDVKYALHENNFKNSK